MVALSAFVFLSILSTTAFAAPVTRALPTPVSVATAKTYLSELVVAVDSNSPAYSRDLFKTWDISRYHFIYLLSYTEKTAHAAVGT